MSWYLLLKTLHILSSTVLFGTGLGSAYYALRAWRGGEVAVIAATFRHLVTADWLFIATTALLQPISGVALAYVAGWPLNQLWLLWSMGLFVLAGCVSACLCLPACACLRVCVCVCGCAGVCVRVPASD